MGVDDRSTPLSEANDLFRLAERVKEATLRCTCHRGPYEFSGCSVPWSHHSEKCFLSEKGVWYRDSKHPDELSGLGAWSFRRGV